MKTGKTKQLEDKLARSGFSHDAIRAAWPSWWSDEAADSPSAFNDLKFSLSRKLGIAPTSLFDEGNAVFTWRGEAKFKGLKVQTAFEQDTLVAYSAAISRLILSCSDQLPRKLASLSPLELRQRMLGVAPNVGLKQLLGLADYLGIPIVYLRVFPLEEKRMTAMSIKIEDRFVILIGREVRYPAWLSFYVAHELGHIILGHLENSIALVDTEMTGAESDPEEKAADQFALALLTGNIHPEFQLNQPPKNSVELADAVRRASQATHIDMGTLALCYGFSTQDWKIAGGAIKCLYGNGDEIWTHLNALAVKSLDLSRLSEDSREFLSKVLELAENGESSSR